MVYLLFCLSVITPVDPYPLVGENLTLTCRKNPEYPEDIDVGKLQFYRVKGAMYLDTTVLDDQSVTVTLTNLTLEQSGYYYCVYNKTINRHVPGTEVNVGCKLFNIVITLVGLCVVPAGYLARACMSL